MISSTANARVKEVCALQAKASVRKETGLFVVEGLRMICEVPQEQLVSAFCLEGSCLREEERALAGQIGAETVTEEVMRKMSDTRAPQGLLAVVRQSRWTAEELLRSGRPVLILEHMQDPGNLGTAMRSAEAAGAAGILTGEGTADLWNPKTVRSTKGSVFRLPFVRTEDLPAAVRELKEAGFTVFAADAEGGTDFTKTDYPARAAVMIGNEGNGLSEEMTALADRRIFIPMEGQVESLNAAVAAALILYEIAGKRP